MSQKKIDKQNLYGKPADHVIDELIFLFESRFLLVKGLPVIVGINPEHF